MRQDYDSKHTSFARISLHALGSQQQYQMVTMCQNRDKIAVERVRERVMDDRDRRDCDG